MALFPENLELLDTFPFSCAAWNVQEIFDGEFRKDLLTLCTRLKIPHEHAHRALNLCALCDDEAEALGVQMSYASVKSWRNSLTAPQFEQLLKKKRYRCDRANEELWQLEKVYEDILFSDEPCACETKKRKL